ncbi:protein containing Pyridoxal phosphate-dependent enzyme, beta subunit domain [Sulfurimonas gotlandica GD1]|jgi:1-aminocyclopropane-1-carboxylate deaminase|uniref:Protein containing Pyridoxal phosphate-dependent enzyme, beta subunit domain n=1 Tax=Sulfurimonas gotlandica (strain DSM 19862 / JCM 16533 / GD1) TaxID=929558 RepID=B6BIQ8_SULGG|nr:1-aminocyclopropane-1-carboxylate deaminase [Sulfurimonas gotlandica]EDZ63771.1 1-aminocyclopropane-1-carboxylate deaminase [Sulfurimonas gotlandica GD1]EHP30416.1 protein containing Pyridoxal phosphate-dependent enzyme, beta subunit domain [Sulfurimonas gotlandica GD1]
MNNSPISKISLEGRDFYVKRDDLIDPFLAGNKYRKLYTLLKTPSNKLHKIISYGGTQSNAMLAIAAMCKSKGWEFDYYTKPLSQTQKSFSHGNYFHSINLGMNHIEIAEVLYKDFIASISITVDATTFIIDQGGAVEEAKKGLEVLAQEIREANLEIKSLATPSGTGTTALFLALSLPEFKVYTTPCVGNTEYLREQMQALHELPDNLVILEPLKKHHFAKPYPEFLDIYKKLLEAGVEFDLLYAPGMWEALLNQTNEEILYIHSGGVSGNESMLKRYEQKGFY